MCCATQRKVRLTRGPCSPDAVQCTYSDCVRPSMTRRSPWSNVIREGTLPRPRRTLNSTELPKLILTMSLGEFCGPNKGSLSLCQRIHELGPEYRFKFTPVGRRRRPHPRRQGLRSPWGVVRLAPCLLPGPGGCPLAPWSAVLLRAVVRRSSQGRSDRLLLVSPPRAQPSLPPTLSSSRGLPAGHHRKGHTTPKKMKVLKGATWLCVVVVVVVVVVVRTTCSTSVSVHASAPCI